MNTDFLLFFPHFLIISENSAVDWKPEGKNTLEMTP